MPVDVEAFYRRYGFMVFAHCRSMLGDEGLAEDAMQEVFVQLHRSRERLHDGAPASLLLRMATNVCLNRQRTRRRHPEDLDPDLLTRIATAPLAEERSWARAALDRIFGQEEESTRVMAVLHLLHGMTLAEVAEEMGMSVSGVRYRLRRLKQHVHELEGV